MIGWRGRIGKICPGDWALGPEYDPVLPEGIVIWACTLGLGQITPSEMQRVYDLYLDTAKHLAEQECDVIVVAGTPIQAYMGYDQSLELISKMEAVTGLPVFMELQAGFEALKFLGVKQIVLATPYEEARNQERKALCEQMGLEVLNMKGLGLRRSVDIARQPDYASYRLAKQAFMEAPRAEAIWISCPVWPTVRNIARLENDTGVPVITSVNSIIWASLRAMKIRQPILGYGKLLE